MADKLRITKLLKATAAYYRQDVSDTTLQFYLGALEAYPDADVERAVAAHMREPKGGQFMPKIADIVGQIERVTKAAIPSAEEAWALVPKDEHTTAVITEAMAAAWGVAMPLYMDGDKYGARLAFIAAYERELRAGKPTRWFPSLGTDHAQRETALQAAAERGLLTAEHAKALLPHSDAKPTESGRLALAQLKTLMITKK